MADVRLDEYADSRKRHCLTIVMDRLKVVDCNRSEGLGRKSVFTLNNFVEET